MLYFFFLGLFQSLLTIVLLVRRENKKPADRFLLLLVICFAIHFLSSFLLYELVSDPSFRKGFLNFATLAYGPLVLMYARKSKGQAPQWLYLAPATIAAVAYSTILGAWLAGTFTDYHYLHVYNRMVLALLAPVNIIGFIIALRATRSYREDLSSVKNLIRTISITGSVSLTIGVPLSFLILAKEIPFGLSHQVVRTIGALACVIACLSIARYALLGDRPRVFAIHALPKTSRPAQLRPERQKEMYDQLIVKVEQSRLYLDPDLNMEKLTAATGYSRHQISEILNQYADISFYPFINRFRVEQVCEQMKKAAAKSNGSSLNMLDLSYACGFKSKSSFNEYFRRFTGQTPSEYWGHLNARAKKA